MISVMHVATVVNAGRRDRRNLEINNPWAAVHYNKFMKNIDRAEQ